jgi:coenzyme F420 hydrogenase subunit beta
MSGQERLKSEILDKDICSSCGLCVGLCPYIKSVGDGVKVIYPCGLDEGACYAVCPWADMDVRLMDLAVFGREREDHALGVMEKIFFARARNKPEKSQYGGVTSALAALALREGIVSAMALTGGGVQKPKPVLARTPEEVYECAGSKYTAVPTMEVVNRALRDGISNLGVVARPCQAAAVRRAERDGPAAQHFTGASVSLLLGLFCFWSLSPGFYDFLSAKVKGEKVYKMDIPETGPLVEAGGGTFRWHVDELRPYIRQSCNVCFDSTSEWADISIGSTEYDPAWNTLIVRTSQGADLLDLAMQRDMVEIREYPPERLPLLRRAALNKKMRVLALPEYNAGKPGCPLVAPQYMQKLEEQWGGLSRDT